MVNTKDFGLQRSRGLANLGNTCWLNSILQCLAQTPTFLIRMQRKYSYLAPGGELKINDLSVTVPSLNFKYENSGVLTSSLIDVLCQLGNGETKTTVKPTLFVQAVTKEIPILERGQQHDAHEFLGYLIDLLNTEMKESFYEALSVCIKTYVRQDLLADHKNEEIIKGFYMEKVKLITPIERIFQGSIVNRSECQECKDVTLKEEHFFNLMLPIAKLDGNCTLDLCLAKYFCEELLTNNEKRRCEKCSKMFDKIMLTDTLTCLKISDAPKALTISLNRYKFSGSYARKDHTVVKFPQYLNISQFCTERCINLSNRKEIVYALYAVEEHCGTVSGGHHTSYRRLKNQGDRPIRNKVLPGEFIFTSDSSIVSVPESEVIKAKAYILFYERLRSF